MFAGKSSAILGIIRRNKVIGRPTLCLTSHLDKRYKSGSGAAITSHNKDSHPAIAVRALTPILESPAFADARCIIIEEAQFFPDLKAFVLEAVEVYEKEVIVVGLDGDSSRKPFGEVLDLIPYCDTIHKLTALCTHCGDGTAALFSHRKPTAATTTQVNVGAQDQYEPLCRKHFLNAVFEKQVEDHILKGLMEKLAPEKELNRCIELFGIDYGSSVFAEIVRRKNVRSK